MTSTGKKQPIEISGTITKGEIHKQLPPKLEDM
jgi:hypothetical protein